MRADWAAGHAAPVRRRNRHRPALPGVRGGPTARRARGGSEWAVLDRYAGHEDSADRSDHSSVMTTIALWSFRHHLCRRAGTDHHPTIWNAFIMKASQLSL